MSVKLLVIVVIVFKRYSSTYCLMQGSLPFVATFKHWNSYLKIRITTFKGVRYRVWSKYKKYNIGVWIWMYMLYTRNWHGILCASTIK